VADEWHDHQPVADAKLGRRSGEPRRELEPADQADHRVTTEQAAHALRVACFFLEETSMSLTYFGKLNGGTDELWVTDGTTAGTHLVKSIGAPSFIPMIEIGARVFFSANDGVDGSELWTSDGTSAGTVLLKDINSGPGDSGLLNLTDINGTLFFTANDGAHGAELWKSDGTAGGTVMVADINPGGASSPDFQTNVNGTLFFQADDGIHGVELWKSDGTTAGTVLVKDINPGVAGSSAQDFTSINGGALFIAFDLADGAELWRTDGTAAGTVMVRDINPGPANSFPGELTNVNGTIFFQANDGTNGIELWKSDGTASGTAMVKNINPSGGSDPLGLTNVNGTLFFVADDGSHGQELWKSDGTAAGTVLVKDINPGASSSAPQQLTNVDGMLFFTAVDGVHGDELWESDGTSAGTVMVKDIRSGPASSNPRWLTNVNGVLEFEAFDGTTEDLFRTDGTAAGTVLIATNVDLGTPIGFTPPAVTDDLNADRLSDILWRKAGGGLADWSMNGGSITSGSFLSSGGAAITPDSSWSVAGISDFNGDGNADVLWRRTDGTLSTWIMNGSSITSSAAPNLGGSAITPDASWTVAGVGDFDGDSRSDILWRKSDGTLAEWTMNGSTIVSSAAVTSGGATINPDASWSVAGIGDFDGDGRKDGLWRNSSGEVSIWLMNGSRITSSGDITSGGAAVRPDPSWSIAGIGDFNHDGDADVLWRRSDGSLAIWLMNGTTITGGGSITSGGAVVAPDASWHVVEIGDFNGDNNTDILWRSDSGALSEWLMNGTTISQSLTPSSGGAAASPDASWSPQVKPTNYG
jgi:ELWxxDGT repeat protein